MGLWNMENFLSSHLEGFFNRHLGGNVELVELVARIEKEVSQKVKKSKDGRTEEIPRLYIFHLSTDDYHRLCSARVFDALYVAVERMIIHLNLALEGRLSIRMVQDSERKLGSFALKSYYSMAEAGEPDTLIIERTHIFRELTLDRTSTESERKLAVLEVVEGVDTDMTLEIGEGHTSIGRQETNDFILTDTNASRCHAYIDYEDHRHVIHDAGSTNGTFVNGKRVRKAMLQPGDRIRTGETVFRYEVI